MTERQLSEAAMATALALMLTGCGDQGTQQRAHEPVANGPAATEGTGAPTPAARSIMQPSVIPAVTPPPPPLAEVSETIHFAVGGPKLDQAAKDALDRLIANPTTASGGAIVLRGSSDSGGSDRDNLAMSRKRGEAVAAYLKDNGIAPDRMAIIALGEGRPVAPNVNLDGSDNPDGRARNRRVDITVKPGPGAAAASDKSSEHAAPAGGRPEVEKRLPSVPGGASSSPRDDTAGR